MVVIEVEVEVVDSNSLCKGQDLASGKVLCVIQHIEVGHLFLLLRAIEPVDTFAFFFVVPSSFASRVEVVSAANIRHLHGLL